MRASGLGMVDVIIREKTPAYRTERCRQGCRRYKFKSARLRRRPLQIKIEGALVVQQGEVAQYILRDFFWRGLGIDFLKIRDDLPDGVLAVAAFDNFQAWAVEAQGALGHEQHALVVVFAEAASGGEARSAVRVRRFFFSSRRRHTRCSRDWSSDVCSSDLSAPSFDALFAPGCWPGV